MCTNLQPAALRGVTSEGMVLAASLRDPNNPKELLALDLVAPPAGAKVGERVTFEGDESEADKPHITNARLKKLLKELHTNSEGVALFKDQAFLTSAGKCTSSLKDATIS